VVSSKAQRRALAGMGFGDGAAAEAALAAADGDFEKALEALKKQREPMQLRLMGNAPLVNGQPAPRPLVLEVPGRRPGAGGAAVLGSDRQQCETVLRGPHVAPVRHSQVRRKHCFASRLAAASIRKLPSQEFVAAPFASMARTRLMSDA
jgi:hypothetical protein